MTIMSYKKKSVKRVVSMTEWGFKATEQWEWTAARVMSKDVRYQFFIPDIDSDTHIWVAANADY